jgi:hypothetical protein
MSEWISVKDRLPEEAGYYLVYPRDKYHTSWFNRGFAVTTLYSIKVTHWMPLPQPPETDK